MSNWFKDNSQSIGHTPMVRLNRITDNALATVLGKIEGRNPAYSVKCRIGAGFVPDNLNFSIVDEVKRVSNEDAKLYARCLVRKNGILFEGVFNPERMKV